MASYNDDRVQIIDITNPANPDATESTFRAHGGAVSVTTAVIDGRIYALVASYDDSGVQIIDITNPARPTATASVTDGQGGFDELEGAASVTTAVIDGRTYALVASQTDNGTQIIDITDPLRPTATASVTNGTGGFDELGGAYSVATAVIDGRTYALVASYNDDGVQIIDVSDPVSPEPIYSWPYIALAVMQDDRRAVYVAGSETATLTFEYAVQGVDSSSDLAYTGTGALVVPPLSRIKDQDSGAAITPELPVPGQPNSLSANKDIVIRATPTAHAGPDQTVNEGATVTLDGSGSSSPDNDPPTYSWSQTSGTPAVSLTGADTASPTFKAPTVTSDTALVFTLTVSGNTDSATDTVTITIRDIAMLVSISSTNDNGTYVAGDTVNITATFSAAVAIEASNMVDGEGGFYTLGGAVSVTTAVIDGRTYALVASFDDSGVQIIDITNPARPTATASATDWQDGFDELEGAYSVATAVIDGRTYALVASNDDDGVQIIDITDPASPNATASVTNGTGGFDKLGGARYVTTAVIDGRTYALVASQTDDGVQIIDITDPARPTAAASVTDGQGGFYTLGGAVSVTTAVIDGRTYALVASFRDDGVQIIDITDPASPSATASVTNGTGGFYTLGGAVSVTTAVIDGSTYALVAAALSNGVQIIDITDPASPSATASVTNGTGGFDELGGAYSVTTAVIDGRTYALVASFRDSGVQIMDITDPARPTATASVTDGQGGFDELGGAYSVTTAVIDGRTYALVAGNSDHGIQIIAVSDPVSPEPIYSWPYIALAVMQDDRRAVYAAGSETATLTFEYVVQDGDFSPDLAYTGTDALVVPPLNRIKDQNRGTVITPELPVPGQPNSLSANKDIAIGATPTAHAGPDQTVNEGATVTLDGSGSSSLYDDPPTYSWSQTSGTPTVSLTGADTASPTFKAPTVTSDTALVFTLTVSDNTDSATDTVTITIRDIAMLVSISSTNDNGTYVAGDTINITATFSEAVAVETSGMVDGQGGFDELDGAVSVATAVIDGRTYALVASHDDDGVQIIDITDPASPSATASVTNGTGGFDELDDAFSITTAVIDGRAYALVANAAGRGVQIINITDPASPSATASVTSGQGGFGVLDGVYSVTTAVIDGRTYALVTSLASGVQIMDITDPASPNATAYVTSGQGGFGVLSGAFTATTAVIDGRTYALVTTTSSNGVQIIDITDPSMPTATASVTNGTGGFDKLGGARYVTTAVIDGRTYALVASQTDNGVQIIDITDPASPSATASITNGTGGFDELGGAYSVATAVIDGRTYALVASGTDDGVQIIDITDPASPSATASVTDGQGGFDELEGAASVTTAVIDGRTYALVASYNDDGVQMIDVSDPIFPEPVYSRPYIALDVMQPDRRAAYVAGSGTATLTFEYVVQDGDFSPDLAYTGTDALVVPPLNKIKDQDSGVAIAPELPVPGQPNSLSANKDIVIGAILTANAGPDQTVDEGATVTLSGTVTDADPEDALAYSWTHNSTLTISLADSAALDTSFTAPNVSEDTPVEFTLRVSDGTASVSDKVIITIQDSANAAPTVNAGPDQEVAEGSTVSLDGTADDSDAEDALAYSWTHNSTALTITLDASAEDPSFTAPNVSEDTPVEFTLRVSDGTASVSDKVIITIQDSANAAPTVNAGPDQEVAEGSTVSLDGTADDSDAEDALAYSWTHNSTLTISLADSAALDTSFTAPNVSEDTPVEFTLRVSDGTASVSDKVIITIQDSANAAPTVNAGPDQEVAEGSTVSLDGTADDSDAEDALAYSWTHNSTLTISLADSAALDTSFTAPNVSEDTPVEFTLRVSDGTASVSDKVIITIQDSANAAPTVNAGPDQEVAEGSTVSLDGTADDSDAEDALAYSWTHNSTLTISLADSAALDTSFTAPNVSEDTPVEFTLRVSDGTASVSDKVIITIQDSANAAPTVNAGPDQEVAEGSTVSLDGTADDSDAEDALAYSWTHNSTALTITLDASAEDPSFTAPNVSEDTPVEFTLRVSDGTASVSDKVIITIQDSANAAPTVNAGPDQEVAEGSTVSLDGTADDSDAEDALAYSWTHNSTLTISLADSAALDTSFTAPNVSEDTPVEFTLRVSDGTASVSDKVIITIQDSANAAPTVNAGPDQEVAEGSTVSLDGTADDSDAEDALAYSWTHNSTLTISLADSAALDTSFTAPNVSEDTPVEFTLRVSDGTASVSDKVIITIQDSANAAPTVNAGPDQEVAEGSTVSLDGTADDSDAEDALAYSWTHNSTALTITLDASAEDPSFTAPNVSEDTPVEFTLRVSDGTASVSDKVIITIQDSANAAPTVNAGPDQEVAEGSTVSLDGTADDSDAEDALAYSWTHNSTLTISLADSAALDTSFTAPNVSEDTPVEFTLRVSDGTASVSDKVIITIQDSANAAPTVNAGPDQEVAEGSTVSLDGTADDSDAEDALAYSWTHNSTLTISLADSAALDTSFTAPNVSEDTPVEFTLRVSDGTASVSDKVIITIQDSANAAPTVNAGPDQEVAEGSTVSLDGTADDSDAEDALAYSWTHNSTLTISLADSAALDTSFTAPNVSEDTPVEFTLRVSDGTASVSDKVIITIQDSANAAPTVNAGPDQEVAEGSTVSLDGTADDSDAEDALAYSWTHNSTLTISLADSAALDTSFTAPNVSEDTLVEFTLRVSDGTASVSDKVIITIQDSANAAPTVNAGPDQEVAEGSTVSLDGTADDSDAEDALAYSWTHNSTLTISLADSAALDTSFTAPNVSEDTPVEFTLRVSDGTASVSDKVIITIQDSANAAPTVNAGPDQEVAEGSTVSLDGTADDSDAEDALAYSWTHNSTLTISLADSAALDTSFTAPNVSEDTPVEFTLRVSDGTASVSDKVIITIQDSANAAPTVNAGPDQEVAEGSTVSLDGTADDSDAEDALAYSWTHNSTLTISLADSAALDTSWRYGTQRLRRHASRVHPESL